MTEDMNPEETLAGTGTPQAAQNEALKAPAIEPVDVDAIKQGEILRVGGLLYPMPDEWGAGTMRICPASTQRVSVAREDHDLALRKYPKVRKVYGKDPSNPLGGKAGTELNRFTVVMAISEWQPDRPMKVAGKVVDPGQFDEVELRMFINEHFLPPLNMESDQPPELELNMPFLLHVLNGLGEVNDAPAQEIARVGKDYRIGAIEAPDYTG